MTELGTRTQRLLPQLSIDEKAAITAGSGFFTMTGVERLAIPNWGTTDGPNGARGSSFLGSGESKASGVGKLRNLQQRDEDQARERNHRWLRFFPSDGFVGTRDRI